LYIGNSKLLTAVHSKKGGFGLQICLLHELNKINIKLILTSENMIAEPSSEGVHKMRSHLQ